MSDFKVNNGIISLSVNSTEESSEILCKDLLILWETHINRYKRDHRISDEEFEKYYYSLTYDGSIEYESECDAYLMKFELRGYPLYQLIEFDRNLKINYPVSDADLNEILHSHKYKVKSFMYNNDGIFTIM